MQHKVKIVSKVVILNDLGEILVLRRSKTDSRRPGTWDLPGGEVDENEDPAMGAAREAREEAEIELRDIHALHVVSQEHPDQFVVTTIFRAVLDSGEVSLSYEHDDYKWITPEEFASIEIPEKYKVAVKNL